MAQSALCLFKREKMYHVIANIQRLHLSFLSRFSALDQMDAK
jgi:hypothetical protein